jgi:uncharacterized SAM-dependent methyltransferase
MPEQFRKDVEQGLGSKPKTLPSKYSYDKKGDELFVQIMNLPTEENGIAISYLVSTAEQTVTLNGSATSYHFARGEKILTEISRKYNDEIINRIIQNTDFQITRKLTDRRGYFADYILKRV